MKWIRITLLLTSCIFLASCLEKVDIELKQGLEDGVVIRAELSKGEPSVLEVYLDRVYNFEVQSLRPLNARIVTLIDDSGMEMEISKITDGRYTHVFTETDPIQVRFEQKYALRVETFDGRTFESSMEGILPTPGAGEMYAEASVFERINEITNRLE